MRKPWRSILYASMSLSDARDNPKKGPHCRCNETQHAIHPMEYSLGSILVPLLRLPDSPWQPSLPRPIPIVSFLLCVLSILSPNYDARPVHPRWRRPAAPLIVHLRPIVTGSLLDLTFLGNARTTRAHSHYYCDGPCLVRAQIGSWEGRVTHSAEHAWVSTWQDLLPVKGCLAGCPGDPMSTWSYCLAPLAVLYKDISIPCIDAVCPILFASHSQLGRLVKTLACFFPNLLD